MEREQICEHATALWLSSIPPGAVRANVETTGLSLVPLAGKQIQIGEATILIVSPRDPCAKMDAVCNGLRELMTHQRQGVLAQVIKSGKICIGDEIRVETASSKPAAPLDTRA